MFALTLALALTAAPHTHKATAPFDWAAYSHRPARAAARPNPYLALVQPEHHEAFDAYMACKDKTHTDPKACHAEKLAMNAESLASYRALLMNAAALGINIGATPAATAVDAELPNVAANAEGGPQTYHVAVNGETYHVTISE